MIDFCNKLKPAVSKKTLFLTAGLMWSGVGILLGRYVYHWMLPLSAWQISLILLAGGVLGLLINRFGFTVMAKKNIHRITQIKNARVCIFAFQEWHSYPLVLVMVSLGVFLRLYSSLPNTLLAVVYLGIGGGLMLASLQYYQFLKEMPVEEKIHPGKGIEKQIE
ncbi:MAG: hypothetical protein DWQ07_18880 [Chloroflexi bacterium]|nr:MAG: hypothetical protein DWQ07_18880 [Chloroflexota bacterium]MBL1194998.1 hypothetical protein [Chloroflexota bacterium]NOH12286.1 hypothetical protein [Chloroflexota bacterium]